MEMIRKLIRNPKKWFRKSESGSIDQKSFKIPVK
jgi:hypothetical protein